MRATHRYANKHMIPYTQFWRKRWCVYTKSHSQQPINLFESVKNRQSSHLSWFTVLSSLGVGSCRRFTTCYWFCFLLLACLFWAMWESLYQTIYTCSSRLITIDPKNKNVEWNLGKMYIRMEPSNRSKLSLWTITTMRQKLNLSKVEALIKQQQWNTNASSMYRVNSNANVNGECEVHVCVFVCVCVVWPHKKLCDTKSRNRIAGWFCNYLAFTLAQPANSTTIHTNNRALMLCLYEKFARFI